jgi:hypothetical protein
MDIIVSAAALEITCRQNASIYEPEDVAKMPVKKEPHMPPIP